MQKKKLILFLLFVILFFAIPAKSWACLNGLPLNHPLDFFFLLLLVFIFFILKWKKEAPVLFKRIVFILAALIVLKFSLNFITLQRGLKGFYYNNKSFSGDYEKSTEFRRLDATRIDEEISFHNIGYSLTKNPFNIWFINGKHEANYDFSVIWKGHLYAPETEKRNLTLLSSGQSQVRVNDRLILDSGKNSAEKLSKDLLLTQGFNEIEIQYVNESIQNDVLELSRAVDRIEKTIGGGNFFPERPSRAAFLADKYGRLIIQPIIFLAPLILLIFIMAHCVDTAGIRHLPRDENFYLFGFLAFFTAFAFFFLLKHARGPVFNILSKGDDWLTFERHARSIIFGDWLVREEAPFYYVPFYRYFLALLHVIFGEGIFMIRWMQFFLFSLTSVLVYKIAKKIFNTNVAVLSLFLFSFTSLPNLNARLLLSGTLAAFLSCLSIYFLIEFLSGKKAKLLFISGAFLGLAVITRPNLASYLFFVIPWLYFRLNKQSLKFAAKHIAVFLAGVMIIISCVTVRNYVTSGKFVLLTTSLSINLEQGNEPPPSVDLGGVERNRVYNFFGFDRHVRHVLEYIRQEPLLFIKGLGVKMGYIAGIDPHDWAAQEKDFYIDKFLTFTLFVIGLFYAMRVKRFDMKKDFVPVAAFPLMIILTLTLVKPMNYGWRLQLQAVPFMLIFAAFFMDKTLTANINFRNPAFYVKYMLLAALFCLIMLDKFLPFAYVAYSTFYFLNYRNADNSRYSHI